MNGKNNRVAILQEEDIQPMYTNCGHKDQKRQRIYGNLHVWNS